MSDRRLTERTSDSFAVAFALVFPTLLTWVYFVLLFRSNPSLQQAAYAVGKTIQFVFPVTWVVLVQRRRRNVTQQTEVGNAAAAKSLGEGILFGLVVLAAMFAVYHAWFKPAGYLTESSESIRDRVVALGADNLWKYAALGLFYSLVHSFLEEYYWRWFVYGELARLIPWKVAVVVSSLGFMAHHVVVLATYFGWLSPLTVLFSLSVAVGGAYWAWLYRRSGSLVGPWLSHLLVDAAIFVVGYDLVRPL